MTLQEELERASVDRDTVLTIGVFDGVHLGHQHLFRKLIDCAHRLRCASAVVTFTNHPRTVLYPGTKITYVTTFEERLRLIRERGIELVVPITFTQQVRNLRAREFVGLLCDKLRMKGLVVGPDFALGRDREGNEAALKALGRELGYEVSPVTPLKQGDLMVSSTAIRDALALGELPKVAKLLGRPFALVGTVVHGDARGRALGFPTANITYAPDQALPADGVYVTRAFVEEQAFKSVTNIGVRPTFNLQDRTVEAFIMDFEADLYGKSIKLEILQRLRGEEKFTSIDALKAQMARDVEMARALLR